MTDHWFGWPKDGENKIKMNWNDLTPLEKRLSKKWANFIVEMVEDGMPFFLAQQIAKDCYEIESKRYQ